MRHFLEDVLVASAIASHSGARGLLQGAPRAKSRALATSGADEERLLAWIANLPKAKEIRHELRRLRHLGIGVVALTLALGLVLGWTSATAAIQGEGAGAANVAFILTTTVIIPLGFLLLWAGLFVYSLYRTLTGPSAHLSPSALTGMLAYLGDLWSARTKQDTADPNARRLAISGLWQWMDHSRFSLWAGSALSHAFWCAIAVGALSGKALAFYLTPYDFSIGTTIGSEEGLAGFLSALGWLPSLFGVTVPEYGQLVDPRSGALMTDVARREWGFFLLACVLFYALVPRLLLLTGCAYKALSISRNAVLDPARPVFREALMQLRQEGAHAPPEGTRPRDVLGPGPSVAKRPSRGKGAYVGVVGLELPSHSTWLQDLDARAFAPVGNISSRNDADQVARDLRTMRADLEFVAVVASAARTPDRNAVAVMARLADAACVPLILLLLDPLDSAADDTEKSIRMADWNSVAHRAGAQAVSALTAQELQQMSREDMRAILVRTGTV